MNWRLYRKLKQLIKVYLTLEGLKVKFVSTGEDKCFCPKCFGAIPMEQMNFLLGLTERGIVYYVGVCSTCRIAYVHKHISIEGGERIETNTFGAE